MNNITINTFINYFLLISSALLGYFAFTDLQISIAVANEASVWANILERFGEVPGLLVLFTGTHIYLAEHFSELKFKKLLIGIFLFFAAFYLFRHLLITIYCGVSGSYTFLEANKFLIIIATIIVNLLLALFLRRLQFTEYAKMYAKSSVLLGLYGYLLLIQPIKHLWGRVRFRDLDTVYSNFTNWFVINGINGNQSFPSGHSAMAWIILPLLFLVIHKKKIVKMTFLFLIICWGIIVGVSRIVIGAHYASDTLFAAVIMILIFLLICKKFSTGK